VKKHRVEGVTSGARRMTSTEAGKRHACQQEMAGVVDARLTERCLELEARDVADDDPVCEGPHNWEPAVLLRLENGL